MSDPPWYERLFEEVYLRKYAPILARMDTAKEVEFLLEHLHLEPGMRVLDLCCGQGRHAVLLAKRGLRVVGQDHSQTLLERARESARAAGVEVELVRRDMREIEWTAEFDAVLNLFTAFGYFEEDRENFRVLTGVTRALKPGGRFAIDIISYPWLMRNWEPMAWNRGEGGLLWFEERRMDWARGIQGVEHTYIEPDGRRWALTHRLRLFPSHELVEWLRRAGLETEALFGDFSGAPYDLKSPRLIALSKKIQGSDPER